MARLRRGEQFWKERVQQWLASGLGAREFAAREGVRAERLFFWKRRLRASSAMAVAGVSFAKVNGLLGMIHKEATKSIDVQVNVVATVDLELRYTRPPPGK